MRYAWTLRLKPGMAAEYKRRHDELWPEMSRFLGEAGYRDYAIFRDGQTLFGTFATDDLARLQAAVRESPVAARWRAHMADVVDNTPDPQTGSPPLLELQFYHP